MNRESQSKMKISEEADLSKTVFFRIGAYELYRYLRRRAWNIVSIMIIIAFFGAVEFSKEFWPREITNPGSFYFFSAIIIHEILFILNNLIMMIIYKSRLFECYKTSKEPWPWDDNINEWNELLKNTFKMLFVNQGIVLPLSLFSYYYYNICPNDLSYETLPSLSTIALHLVIFLFCEDFSFYWAHRLLHHRILYNEIHKIHHQHRRVVGIASEYCHPIEYLIANLIASTSGPLLMGKNTHLLTYFVWGVIRIAETTDGHSGYEFPWSPFRLLFLSAGQEYHSYHHLNFDGNYGSFLTIWDRVFKTTNKAFLKFIDNKFEGKDEYVKLENPYNEKKE